MFRYYLWFLNFFVRIWVEKRQIHRHTWELKRKKLSLKANFKGHFLEIYLFYAFCFTLFTRALAFISKPLKFFGHFEFRSEFLRCFSFFRNLWFLDDSSIIFDIFLAICRKSAVFGFGENQDVQNKEACAQIVGCGFPWFFTHYLSFMNFIKIYFRRKKKWKFWKKKFLHQN